MRLRLLLAFLMIVLVTLAVVSITVRFSAEQQVAVFRARGGWIGAQDLINNLQTYYQTNGSWHGVETLLDVRGRGVGAQGGHGQSSAGMSNIYSSLRLADAQGNLVYDPENTSGGQLSTDILNGGVALESKDEIIGYLLPLQGQTFPGSEFDQQILALVNKAALMAALIAGGLALVLALLLAYFLLRPVQQLTEAAADMANGDLSRRVQVKGGHELAVLEEAFNHMAASLQDAQSRRSALTADIAHELRTPLSVQRVNLEAMLDGIYPLDTNNLEKVLAQNSLLTRLVQDLRTLTLADAGELRLEKTQIQISDLVERLAARFQPQADRKEIRIFTTNPIEPLRVQADPQRLEQILGNLLDNALRYTPHGKTITMSVSREKGYAVVRVHDSGPGIPEEAQPYVFERFYRPDKGRAREEGGSGLGLAIARKLAEAHAGTLTAANHPQGGAVFQLSLPCT